MAIILFDIDMTLADNRHRLHHIDKDEPDWRAFEKDCIDDTLIKPTAEALIAFHNLHHRIWLWTGRTDACKVETEAWLSKMALPYNQLLMAPSGSTKPTETIKRNWLNGHPIPKDSVLCAFDDDPRILRMLHDEGIHTFQVKVKD